ncbi:MAG: right-handed parallel beta-helix repeat-containing protein [Bacteroidetes bacterium]|nr:right-handed parallel beta-helix repeat-containing protein [Bacteroidota bacterium]
MKTIRFSNRRTMLCLLATLCLLCFSLTGFATTYYVSTTGNDATGTGSVTQPWKTLYKATFTVTTPGSIIHVVAGTYVETQQCQLAVGVSIEGDGVTSVLKSTLTADWTEMLGLHSPEGTNGNQHIAYLKFDGQNLSTFWGINVGGRSNVSIHDITMVDFKDRGVIMGGRNDGNGAPPTIYATGNSFYNNIITNCAGYNLSTGVYGRGCLNIGGQDGMLIYNNTISQTSRPEGYNGWPIKGWNEGYLRGCKIYNNILNKIPMGETNGFRGWNFAIELFNESGLEIYGNTITGGCIDMNFQTKGTYAYSVWIHDNTIKQNTVNSWIESGLILEYGTDGAIIENNTIDKVGHGIQFNTRSGNAVSNVIIRKNLITNITMSEGTGGFIGIFSDGSNNYSISNLSIFNNTLVASATTPPWWGLNFGALNAGTAKNISIKNNILMNILSGWLVQGGNNAMDSVTIQYNDAYGNGNGNNPVFNGIPPTHLTSTNNITTNPMFVSATNYTLQVVSPCVDDGTYVGLPFAGTAPDRGFAELNLPLPVKLLDFTVTTVKTTNILQWRTATESNSSYFSIERSTDGQHFSSIGRVSASGFTSSIVNYSFKDESPAQGVNYYRLLMVDKDDTKDYSNTVSANNKLDIAALEITNAQLSAASNNMHLKVNSAQTEKANITVVDVNGRILLNMVSLLQKGINTIDNPVSTMAPGIYYIKVYTGAETAVKNVLATN